MMILIERNLADPAIGLSTYIVWQHAASNSVSYMSRTITSFSGSFLPERPASDSELHSSRRSRKPLGP